MEHLFLTLRSIVRIGTGQTHILRNLSRSAFVSFRAAGIVMNMTRCSMPGVYRGEINGRLFVGVFQGMVLF